MSRRITKIQSNSGEKKREKKGKIDERCLLVLQIVLEVNEQYVNIMRNIRKVLRRKGSLTQLLVQTSIKSPRFVRIHMKHITKKHVREGKISSLYGVLPV